MHAVRLPARHGVGTLSSAIALATQNVEIIHSFADVWDGGHKLRARFRIRRVGHGHGDCAGLVAQNANREGGYFRGPDAELYLTTVEDGGSELKLPWAAGRVIQHPFARHVFVGHAGSPRLYLRRGHRY